MIRASLFDFDGVIADTEPAHAQAFQQYLYENYGVDVDVEIILPYKGITSKEKLVKLNQDRQLNCDPALFDQEELARIYRSIATATLSPRPGFDDLLTFLKERQIKVGVVSSSLKADLEYFVQVNQLEQKLDVIVSYEDVLRHKPKADPYLFALEKLQIEATDAIAIEDTVTGLLAAQAAGIRQLYHFSNQPQFAVPIVEQVSSFVDLLHLLQANQD